MEKGPEARHSVWDFLRRHQKKVQNKLSFCYGPFFLKTADLKMHPDVEITRYDSHH